MGRPRHLVACMICAIDQEKSRSEFCGVDVGRLELVDAFKGQKHIWTEAQFVADPALEVKITNSAGICRIMVRK